MIVSEELQSLIDNIKFYKNSKYFDIVAIEKLQKYLANYWYKITSDSWLIYWSDECRPFQDYDGFYYCMYFEKEILEKVINFCLRLEHYNWTNERVDKLFYVFNKNIDNYDKLNYEEFLENILK